jgi:hypothetical protein
MLFGARSLGEVLVRPLPIEAGGGRSLPSNARATRDRAKARGLAVLTIEAGADAGQASAARRARLRQQLANVDEMIPLAKRIGLH